MAWLQKKADPVSERARDLNAEIAALEKQINQLSSHTGNTTAPPRWRSTTWPQNATHPRPATPEPVFEAVNQDRLKAKTEIVTPPEQFNDLGVRKYDFPSLITRVKNMFRGPAPTNPRLVSYLAGNVQGLRPMRYEKRVARNRLLLLIAGLLLLLLIILSVFIKNH